MVKSNFLLIFVLLPFAALAQESAAPLSLKTVKIVKISAQDRLATASSADGALHLIQVGDELGKGAQVTEITKGRVVVEETTDQGLETVFLILDNGVQRIERIRKTSGERKPLTATGTFSIPVEAQPAQ
jgi:hypothetical protein